jgi:hypothetical protein
VTIWILDVQLVRIGQLAGVGSAVGVAVGDPVEGDPVGPALVGNAVGAAVADAFVVGGRINTMTGTAGAGAAVWRAGTDTDSPQLRDETPIASTAACPSPPLNPNLVCNRASPSRNRVRTIECPSAPCPPRPEPFVARTRRGSANS